MLCTALERWKGMRLASRTDETNRRADVGDLVCLTVAASEATCEILFRSSRSWRYDGIGEPPARPLFGRTRPG
jgi:hypothetical protein